MSEQLRESLSAAMDGEAGEFELKRVLNELSASEELRETWDRYHLVRGLLRRELGHGSPADLTERLWARIEADESLVEDHADGADEGRARRRWWGPVTGAAVAATVALAVVFGFGLLPSGGERELVATSPPFVELQPVSTDAAPAINAFPSRLDLQRTKAYMLHHARHTALNEQGSVLPFAKVAAFETR